MIVTPRYAEEKLSVMLKKITPLGWIATQFSPGLEDDEQKEEVRLQLVVNSLKPLLPEEENVHLFFCHDGDIIILSREVKLDMIKTAIRHLCEIFPQDADNAHAAKIFDFSINFDIFQNLVGEKHEAFKEFLLAEQKEAEPKTERVISVDPAYAQSMLAQRAVREDIHVMLVEDDAFTLQLISNVLTDHTTIRAMDGFDAVETYMLNAPNIVFLDIGLPSLTGHEVLEKILEFDPNAFVVMLSGNSFMEDVAKAMKAGAKGFVAKPFPKEKLLNYVNIYQSQNSTS